MGGGAAPRPDGSRNRLKFSIVVPCFNAQKYIGQTLTSIARQGYDNIEVIVVDGGSSDGTLEIVKAVCDLPIVLISEPDQGQLDAVQKGLRVASGDVFYWLNADDILMPSALKVVSRIFERDSSIDLVYSDDFAFEEESRTLSVGATIRWLGYFEHVFFYRQMYSECVFWRGAKTRFLPDSFFKLRLCTDFAFFANLRFGLKEKWVSKRLGAFRIVPGQISQRFKELRNSERTFIRQNARAQHGWSRTDVLIRKVISAPRFFVLQYCFPRLDRGLRRMKRALSGDMHRKIQTREFFDVWLANRAACVQLDLADEVLER